ncbi:MAG: SDR family oxidoreductase [Bacteroidia bacterium]
MKKECVLVTGGTGKLGSAIVKYLASEGVSICFTSTTEEKAKLLIQETEVKQGSSLDFILVDFSMPEAEKIVAKQLSDSNIEISQIIHNARSLKYLKVQADLTVSEDDFLQELRVNVVVPYRITMELISAKHPLKQVIFISSMYGIVGPTPSLYDELETSSVINYGVSKAAQIHMSKELAIRLSKFGIHVNCVSYGGVEGRAPDSFKRKYEKLNPLGEMLNEQDVIAPLAFLIKNPDMKMTGHNLVIDGGWTIW